MFPERLLVGIELETRRELEKLAVGDIVILKVEETFVEVVTNPNRRLKVERHARAGRARDPAAHLLPRRHWARSGT